jgi:two-component system, sensor histidine kinase YesM
MLSGLGFKTRVFISFILLCLPLILALSAVFYGYLYRGARERTVQEIQKTIHESSVHLELLIEDTENLSRSILFDDEVQDAMGALIAGGDSISLASIQNAINSALAYRDFIDSVVLVSRGVAFFSTESATSDISDMERVKDKWWFPTTNPAEFPFRWVPRARQTEFNQGTHDNGAMLVRRITSKRDYTTLLGIMMIYLDGPYIDSFLDQARIGRTSAIMIVDEGGNAIFQSKGADSRGEILAEILADPEFKAEGRFGGIKRLRGEEYVVSWSRFARKEWSIVSAVPFAEVDRELMLIKQQVLFMIAIFVLVSLLVSFIVSTHISFPIRHLSEMMDRFKESDEGDLSSPLFRRFQRRQDEIGTVYGSYANLKRRIADLIKENYLKDLAKKDAELAALESQINPHFLYNTLDSINWLALANGQAAISEMVTALGDMFRLSLRKSESPYIQVADEMLHVKSYLAIQQHRYGSRLQHRFEIDADAERLFMLRFVVQPLIENALRHGVDRIEGTASIEVSAAISGRELVVSVVNDGIGVDLERIGRILDGSEPAEPPPGGREACYGIRNISERIKLAHGEAYGLAYSSRGGRTICRLTLPMLAEAEAGKHA